MTQKKDRLSNLIDSFKNNDIPELERRVQNLDEKSLDDLPSYLRNLNARLSQILNAESDEPFKDQLAEIKSRLEPLIEACRDRIQSIQEVSRSQLEDLSRGAQLLGSYRLGPQKESRIIDSNG